MGAGESKGGIGSGVCHASDWMASSSCAGVHRWRGFGWSAARNACNVRGGRPCRFALPEASRCSTAIIGCVPNTGAPVAANASTDAVDHQSVASFASTPSMISGAMNPGVPITSPVLVTWLSPSPIAMPKSTSTGPVTEIITLVGLMSRCTMPAACTARTASMSFEASRSRSSPTYRPFCITSSRRFLPSISSVTMNASASSISMSTMLHTPGSLMRLSAIASRRRRSRAVVCARCAVASSSSSESRRIFIA